jgi:hypothetical protein
MLPRARFALGPSLLALALFACGKSHVPTLDERWPADAASVPPGNADGGDAGPDTRDASQASGTVTPSRTDGSTGLAPDDSGPLSSLCSADKREADEDFWAAYSAHAGDLACATNDQCAARNVRVSCSAECVSAALPRAALADVEAALADVEADVCARYRADGCAPPPNSHCVDQVALARCIEGQCTVVFEGCRPGCSLDAQGVCRGEAHCDGCPGVVQDAWGKACAKPEQQCGPPGFCPALIRCAENPDAPGVYQWTPEYLLCARHTAP